MLLDDTIEMNKLPSRVRNALYNFHVLTFRDLSQIDDRELRGSGNFGRASYNRLREYLKHYGLAWEWDIGPTLPWPCEFKYKEFGYYRLPNGSLVRI